MAYHTGQPLEKVEIDTDRDKFMSGEDAKAYGLIDHVVANRDDISAIAETEE